MGVSKPPATERGKSSPGHTSHVTRRASHVTWANAVGQVRGHTAGIEYKLGPLHRREQLSPPPSTSTTLPYGDVADAAARTNDKVSGTHIQYTPHTIAHTLTPRHAVLAEVMPRHHSAVVSRQAVVRVATARARSIHVVYDVEAAAGVDPEERVFVRSRDRGGAAAGFDVGDEEGPG